MSKINLQMAEDSADSLSGALSDVLCWCAGFEAGRAPDGPEGPMNLHHLRSFNLRLKSALAAQPIEKDAK